MAKNNFIKIDGHIYAEVEKGDCDDGDVDICYTVINANGEEGGSLLMPLNTTVEIQAVPRHNLTKGYAIIANESELVIKPLIANQYLIDANGKKVKKINVTSCFKKGKKWVESCDKDQDNLQ
jgi:predicted nucleotidyltransferase